MDRNPLVQTYYPIQSQIELPVVDQTHQATGSLCGRNVQCAIYTGALAGREKIVFERTSTQENPKSLSIQDMDPEPYHYVTNLDTKDFLATRIEIKGSDDRVHQIYENHEIEIKNDQECYVISNTSTALKIYQVIQTKSGNLLAKHQPLDDLQGRPLVWCLSSSKTYLIKNENKEKVNLIFVSR